MLLDADLYRLFGGVLLILTISSVAGAILARRVTNDSARATVANLNARIRSWWIMCAIFTMAILTDPIASVLLFALTSLFALREFITLTPTRRGDHRALFWAFFVALPAQYYLVAIQWYGLFIIFIPVFVFLFLPTRIAISGDTKHFLERAAKIQWGLMSCVYCVSHAPALLMLDIPGYEGQNAKLLFYLVFVTQMSDVLQYVFGKTFGRRKIAPSVTPNKTWEGFLGGIALSTAIGGALYWATPFGPLQALAIALAITLSGFAGGLCMSAIKRDRGLSDFGNMIKGHGGTIDRIDSIIFAAPVFFHITRYYYT